VRRALADREVVDLLEEATQALAGSIPLDARLEHVNGWDSMGMVMFMGLVRDRSGIELSVHDLKGCATPAELALAIAERARS
jgi:acyl carrier protein